MVFLKRQNKKFMEQLIPENDPLMNAPKLNPGIFALVSYIIVNKDKKIVGKQPARHWTVYNKTKEKLNLPGYGYLKSFK